MHVSYVVVVLLLTTLLVASAAGKLAGHQLQLKTLRAVGFPENQIWMLAVAELAGALGLIVGLLVLPTLGLLASVGVICYFLGAVAAHLRAGDRDLVPSGVL